MADFQFTGRIVRIGDVQTTTTNAGTQFSKREVQVETIEEYPNSIVFELINEKATGFAALLGQVVTAHLNFRCSQATTGRVFNNIRCWNLEIIQ